MLVIYECKRCLHKWKSRINTLPKVCPKCKTPYWQSLPKKITKEETEMFFNFIIKLHESIIQTSGGENGIRDIGGLQNISYKILYNLRKSMAIEEQARLILEDISRRHYFLDGNKRTAYCLTKVFLFAANKHLKVNYKEALPFLINIAKYDSKVIPKDINIARNK